MKKLMLILMTVSICSFVLNGQSHEKELGEKYKWYVSSHIGGNLMFFKNQPSDLHWREGKVNTMGEVYMAIELMRVWEKAVFNIGLKNMRQEFSLDNVDSFVVLFTALLGGHTSEPPYREVHYVNDYLVVPIGIGLKINKQNNPMAYMNVGLSNEILYSTEVEVIHASYTSDSERAMWEVALNKVRKNKFQQRFSMGIGVKGVVEKIGLGIGARIQLQKYLTVVNSEFMDRPGGVGFELSLVYGF